MPKRASRLVAASAELARLGQQMAVRQHEAGGGRRVKKRARGTFAPRAPRANDHARILVRIPPTERNLLCFDVGRGAAGGGRNCRSFFNRFLDF
jgi:hypothetical protein